VLAHQLENPVSKEHFTIRDSGPEALVLEVRVPPDMIRPPTHLHRSQQESFEVLHGQVFEALLLAEFRPPGHARSFFETFCGMAAEGRCNAQGSPPFLQIAASARWWDMYLAGPPVALQRALFTTLSPLARLRGYRTSYQRFTAG
jgi:hypothetical protein